MRWLGTALTVPYIPDAYGRWMAVLVRDWTSLLCQAHRDGLPMARPAASRAQS